MTSESSTMRSTMNKGVALRTPSTKVKKRSPWYSSVVCKREVHHLNSGF